MPGGALFAYRLANQMGLPDVNQLRESLPAEVMEGWRAFDEIEGIGLEKLIWTVANVGYYVCQALKHPLPIEVFVPGAKDFADDDQSEEEQMAIMQGMSGA